jgi:hypothetical protein
LRKRGASAIPSGVTRLLPFLRCGGHLLAVIALVSALVPAVAWAGRAAPAATVGAAAPVEIVICTTNGLVTLALAGDRQDAPSGLADEGHCAACLRMDPAVAPPPLAAAPPPAPAPVAEAPPAPAPAIPRATPHVRPDATGPPASA